MTLFRRTALASTLGLLLAPAALAQGGGGASGGAAGGAGAGGMGGGTTGGARGGAMGGAQPAPSPSGDGSATTGASPSGRGGAPGQAGAQDQPGTAPQGRRGALEQQQRAAGVARPPEHDAQQLRDLNAMSRQLAPNAPLPAPEAGMPRR